MPSSARPYRGVFPVVPTIFTEGGELDLAGQKRCVDFMIDAGSTGLLPKALRDGNPLGLWRRVDGTLGRG